MRSELARQLEIALAEWLHDSRLVRPFLAALRAQLLALDALADPRCLRRAAACVDAANGLADDRDAAAAAAAWPALHDDRPPHAPEARWDHLFEFIAFKLVLLLGDHGVLRWVRETREHPATT